MRTSIRKFGFLLMLFIPSLLFSEAYLAVREGLKCSACHINRTGGGKRTPMGAGYGTQNLPWIKWDLPSRKIPHYWSLRDDLISIGGDFRVSNQSTFVENNTANTFQTDKANAYIQLQLFEEAIAFYLDESIAPGGAQAREIFALLGNLPAHGWIKAGKFVLPYGIRLEDDRAFIREATGFNFNNPDVGAEIGFEPPNWSFAISVTNGTAGSLDNNASKQVVGSAVFVHDLFRLGASGSFNPGNEGDKNSAAAWAGLQFRSVTLLGEFDFVREELAAKTREQIISYAEIDYLIAEGWNVKAAYEFFDPDRDIDENERDRVIIGIEPFITPFLQLAVFYRFNQSIPQNILQNADELNFRLHIYF